MSCAKAQEVLERTKISPKEIVDARKVKIEADEAWELLTSGDTIILVKGKRIITLKSAEADRFEVMLVALGRSGTLRAPTIKTGSTWVVGFNAEVYSEIFGKGTPA